jgi:hypothetical protein
LILRASSSLLAYNIAYSSAFFFVNSNCSLALRSSSAFLISSALLASSAILAS